MPVRDKVRLLKTAKFALTENDSLVKNKWVHDQRRYIMSLFLATTLINLHGIQLLLSPPNWRYIRNQNSLRRDQQFRWL